jgi:hypothetical protein
MVRCVRGGETQFGDVATRRINKVLWWKCRVGVKLLDRALFELLSQRSCSRREGERYTGKHH